MTDPRAWIDESLPRRAARVATQRARDTLVLLDLESGRYYTLEGAGDRIWDLCDGQRTVGDIIAAVSRAFGTDPATVRSDALELLDRLSAEGLVDDAR